MLVVVALVTALAYWDEQREAQAALDDFAADQATFAASLAAGLSARGTAASGSATGAAADELARASRAVHQVERPGESVVLLELPGSASFRTTDGRALTLSALSQAIAEGRSSVRLTHDEAAKFGLPERMAYAGIAGFEEGTSGLWHVVAVTTAKRERDREIRAVWRLVLSVGAASGLVIVFGGLVLGNQRRQLELQRAVDVMAVRSDRDERLARATRAAVMGTFAMGITHELSTPLGVILGRAEQILGRAATDERGAHAARVIVEQAEQLKVLIRSFLDLARGGAPTFESIDSTSVVRGALGLVDHRFEKLGVKLVVALPTELPRVLGEASLLQHALVNLLLNACEACEAGGTVEVRAQGQAGEVAFVVTDDGLGIKPEDAARATEPFFTTKPEGQGTGLGLAIASEIVTLHRGTLSIEPLPSRGTRARIVLPVADVPPGGRTLTPSDPSRPRATS